jgi:hypothetical protein
MSKSENSAYFRHFLLITLFWCVFSKLFQWIPNQRKILRCLTPFLIFCKKIFFRSYEYFFQTLIANAQEMAKKKENLFYECVLEFNYATIKGFA